VLIAALKERTLRAQAVTALGNVGPEAKGAIPVLLDVLKDEKSDVALTLRVGSALEQLGGREGVEALLRVLGDAPKQIRSRMVQALGQAGHAATVPLIKLAEDPDANVRAAAVRALSQSNRSAGAIVPTLIKGLRDKNPQVCHAAVRALGQIGPPAGSAIDRLTELLESDKGSDRVLVAEALASVQPGSPRAIAALTDMLKETDPALRRQAIVALGRIGPDADLRRDAALALANLEPVPEDVRPVLREVILDKRHPFRFRAMEAWSRLGSADEATVSLLVRVLWEDGPVRAKAAQLLGEIGPPGKEAVPSLVNVLNGSDLEARIQAALALWKIDRRAHEVVPVLVSALKSLAPRQGSALNLNEPFGASPSARAVPPCQLAADALGQIGPDAQAAVPALAELLRMPQFSLCRPSYAHALWKIDRGAASLAVPPLIELLDGSAPVRLPGRAASALRKDAVTVLGDMGVQAREALPSLRKALADPDDAVRAEAAAALKKMGA
jgi:HEAT repeat protein